jgi:hypothetical protein
MNCKNIINIVLIFGGLYLLKMLSKIEEPFIKNIKNNNYTIIQVDELSREFAKKAKTNNKIRDLLNNKMIEIYMEIKENPQLKTKLEFMNLIHNTSLPLFINEHSDNLMFNQAKILLFTNKIDGGMLQ